MSSFLCASYCLPGLILMSTVLVRAQSDTDLNGTSSADRYSLTVEALNSTTLYCQWNQVNEKNCPTIRYIIRIKSSLKTRARSLRFNTSTRSAIISGLTPATVYHVRLVVDTECTQGRGKASKWATVETGVQVVQERVPKSVREKQVRRMDTRSPQGIPGQPLSVRTRVLRPDTVLVSWQAPADGAPVSGYMIGYGEGVPDVNWQYLESHRRNVTIKNLKPSTQYVVSVRAFNDVDKGPVIYDLVYTGNSHTSTRTVFPAPTRLRTRVQSSTSISLQWTDTSLGQTQRINDNRYYNVHYQALPDGRTMSVIVKDLDVVLHDLDPGTRYEFKVRTVKDGHTSSFSNIVAATTSGVSAPGTQSPSDRRKSTSKAKAMYKQPAAAAADDEEAEEQEDADEEYSDNDLTTETQTEVVGWVEGASLTRGSDGGKTKREQAQLPHSMTETSQSNSSNVATQPDVKFSTLVLHHISVYITWPSTPLPGDRCNVDNGNAVNSTVSGYRLRYQPVDDVTEFISRNVSDNFILLESLRASVKYRYQLKYIYKDGSETDWSSEALVDTNVTTR